MLTHIQDTVLIICELTEVKEESLSGMQTEWVRMARNFNQLLRMHAASFDEPSSNNVEFRFSLPSKGRGVYKSLYASKKVLSEGCEFFRTSASCPLGREDSSCI